MVKPSFRQRGLTKHGRSERHGTIMGIVIKGLAPGTGTLSIVQVSAKDSPAAADSIGDQRSHHTGGAVNCAPLSFLHRNK